MNLRNRVHTLERASAGCRFIVAERVGPCDIALLSQNRVYVQDGESIEAALVRSGKSPRAADWMILICREGASNEGK